MRKTPSGFSPLIYVDRKGDKPLYSQVYDAFRAAIVARNLRAGERIPSTRSLASELGISRIPVLNAYAQLLAEGYFKSRVGAGTFVSSSLPDIVTPAEDRSANSARVHPMPRLIAGRSSLIPRYERPAWMSGQGAFSVGQPAVDTFPFHVWSKIVAGYWRSLHRSALQYGDPMGIKELREAIGTYLRAARSVRCEWQQIMIVSGSQQALDISTRVLLDAGSPVWVEEPGYWLVHHVLKAAGCKLIPVPVDPEGVNVAAGIKLRKDARAVFVAPSHQYPLGVTMSATRRLELLKWAHKEGAWVVEDDYDSEYRYDSMPIASLQGLDNHDRVIYTGTLSKVLFPSLRLGYIVMPPDLVERFAAMRQSMDICPSHDSQSVLAAFIREGHFTRHIRKMRRIYEERRKLLVEEIKRELDPSHTLMGAEAGMHLSLLFGNKLNDRDVVAKATLRRLWLSALSHSYIGRSPRQGLVLGFGNTSIKQIPDAILLLKKILTA